MMKYLLLLLLVGVQNAKSSSTAEEQKKTNENDGRLEYGVDVSYPMHSLNVTSDNPLGNKQKLYDDFMQGCYDRYAPKKSRSCLANEKDRTEMNSWQPKGMVNYTNLGYTKIRAPENVFKLVTEFWEKNKHVQKRERWNSGNTYVNHWDEPTFMTSVEDTSLEGGGPSLKQHLWNAARDTISEWTGQQLAECSLYGIRIYKEGAVLAPHVDRLPLVSSAIINVDQDVDEPWPLEVIGRDGKAVNITMVPGDLVLYESHSIIHGRPFPLKGRFFANIFVHFEPIGPVGEDLAFDDDLPQYVIRGTEAERRWRKDNPNGYRLLEHQNTPGMTNVHRAALSKDPDALKTVLQAEPHNVNARDVNGWLPIHEAVRAGNLEAVKILFDHGADMNARTRHSGRGANGGTPLWWAHKFHDDEHKVIDFLKNQGAKHIGPGLRDEL